MGPKEFIFQYFIRPIQTGEGYNMYNTLVYGVLLLAGAFGVTSFIHRFGVRADRTLFYTILPFAVLGGLVRALEEFARLTDEGLLPHSPLFLTPAIFILIAAVSIFSLGISVAVKGNKYSYSMSAAGWLMVILTLLLILYDIFLVASGTVVGTFLRPRLMLWIILFGSGLTILGIFILRLLDIAKKENALILGGFSFEAAALTIAAYYLSYSAEQPFTQALLTINPLVYPFFKTGLVLALIYVVDGISENDEMHWLGKILFLVLGLPMGIHNSIQIFMGL